MKVHNDNAATVGRELTWLASVIDARLRLYFEQECEVDAIGALTPPPLEEPACAYARVIAEQASSFEARVVLALALAPYVRPQLLDPFFVRNPNLERGFSEFGGVTSTAHGGFWPTVETAAFVLAGADLERRFAVGALFEPEHPLYRDKILQPIDADPERSPSSTPLRIARDYLGVLTSGARYRPNFTSAFPAKRLVTAQIWDDLVLADEVLAEVEEIKAWIEHRHALLNGWQLAGRINPGFRSLFYGPPGTGKTFTAALLGKSTGLDTYRVDLSLVVSKWIGETEKNLAQVFDQAESHDWILFFDEADALFGKRTQTSSAHDRYANQEVSYLLQRVEDFPGVVILASNLKGNIDAAFARRFQSMVYFPVPDRDERLRLWQGAFPDPTRLEGEVDLARLAEEFEITGGAIVNVLRHATLMALKHGRERVRLGDIRQGIRREFRKEGKTL